jgi:hypothetical protein
MLFEPGSLGTFSLGAQISGALSGAFGGFFAAKAQKSALSASAALADTNARIAELGAQGSLAQGQSEVGRLTLKAGNLKSSQRASMAANGIDLGVGNAAEVLASTDTMKEIDSNQITANAVRSAWGLRTQAVNLQNDALIKRATASSVSPMTALSSSLIGSAGKVAGSWYMMNKSGMFDSPSTDWSKYDADVLGNGLRF